VLALQSSLQDLPPQLLLYKLATFAHFIILQRRRGDLNS